MLDHAIAVDELIPKTHDPAPFTDPLRRVRIELVQLAQRLANDQEIPLNRVTKLAAGQILLARFFGTVLHDPIDGIQNIDKEFRRFRPHKASLYADLQPARSSGSAHRGR